MDDKRGEKLGVEHVSQTFYVWLATCLAFCNEKQAKMYCKSLETKMKALYK